jgi:hypothetical protein
MFTTGYAEEKLFPMVLFTIPFTFFQGVLMNRFLSKKACLGILFVLLAGGNVAIQAQQWTAGTGTLYNNPSSTKIGIGTSSPSYILDVASSSDGACTKIGGSSSSLLLLSNANYIDLFGRNGGNTSPKPINIRAGNTATNGIYISENTGTKVGVNTQSPSYTLHVAGTAFADTLRATKIRINNWTMEAPDYVFNKDYELKNLDEVENFISENKHLPEIPSATEMKQKGVDLAEMNMALLKKVEELTLYMIDAKKEMENQKKEIANQRELIEKIIRK